MRDSVVCTMNRRVVVTGLGVVSPVGIGRDEYFRALLGGVSGVGSLTRFDAEGYPVRIAAEVKGFDASAFMERKSARRMDLYSQYAVAAGRLAFEDSGYSVKEDPTAVGALVGSGIGGLDTLYEQMQVLLERGPDRISPFFIPMIIPNMGSAHVSMTLGLKGPVSATCTACAASTHALGDAFEIVRRGAATAMFAGGAEAPVGPLGLSAFAAARALSTRNDNPPAASRPFDRDRDGFVIGEGAAVLVLEEREHALARGARIYAEFLGYGMSGDAHHLTEPDPTGAAAALAMRGALAQAGVEGEDVDYINAHGTSTPLGDLMETHAVKLALGEEAARRVQISSTKSMIGHCLGAAGALEAAATVLTLYEGLIPPTINLDTPDPACDLDYVPKVARRADVKLALSNSFGFGGHNASILLGRHGE